MDSNPEVLKEAGLASLCQVYVSGDVLRRLANSGLISPEVQATGTLLSFGFFTIADLYTLTQRDKDLRQK